MRVMVVDGTAVGRRELVSVLTAAGLEVVADGGGVDGRDLPIDADRPDAMVVDAAPTDRDLPTGGPGSDGDPVGAGGLPTLLLASQLDHDLALRAFDRPDHVGYLCRDRMFDVGIPRAALAMLCAGQPVIDPGVVAQLVVGLRRPGAELTDREREVLELLASGLSERMTATQLVIADHTARTHLRRSFAKFAAAPSPTLRAQVRAVLQLVGC